MTFKSLLFGGGFGESIFFSAGAPRSAAARSARASATGCISRLHARQNPVFWIMAAGVFSAWALYIKWPHLPGVIDSKLKPLRWVLENKYGFDWFNENVLAAAAALLGKIFWKVGDQFIIDKIAVDGSANTIGFIAGIVRRVQSGFLYSYAFWMVIGLAVMLGWFVTRA